MRPIEAKVSSSYYTRIGIVMAIFALPGLCGAVNGVRVLIEGDGAGAAIALGALAFACVGLFFPIMQRGWVKTFDASGVTLRSGRRLPWGEFQAVREVYRRSRYGSTSLNNYDLVFCSGKASVFHLMLENAGEVMAVVSALQRGGPGALMGASARFTPPPPDEGSGMAAGARVRAQAPDGGWYVATVIQTGAGQWLVAFPNGHQAWLATHQLAPIGA